LNKPHIAQGIGMDGFTEKKCSLCGTATKYEYFNKKFHTKSCECGCFTRVFDLAGKLLSVLKLDNQELVNGCNKDS